MNNILIKGAFVVNEGMIHKKDVRLYGTTIQDISDHITPSDDMQIIDASGKYLLPGVIDDQVHFREPGLTHKADIASESKAAIAGGITSFFEMPNTVPQTTTQEKLSAKFAMAKNKAYANYSFAFGGTNDNLEELLKTNPSKVSGIKLFLGSSTGNMLVDDPEVLENIFKATDLPISVHCEDEATIRANLAQHKATYGDDIPMNCHPIIRSEEACYRSSSKAIALAKKTGAKLHVFHLSTAKETALFDHKLPLKEKKITAEVCIHHLCFTDKDYDKKGRFIKWNPAVKTEADRDGLWEALLDDRIDVIATDHAPHTLAEKRQVYTKAPSGGPLVQHALPFMLDASKAGKISLEKVVEKMCHNPAILFGVKNRGFIKADFIADLVLVDLSAEEFVDKASLHYKCGWSPFEGHTFTSKVCKTFVNGHLVYDEGHFDDTPRGERLLFNR